MKKIPLTRISDEAYELWLEGLEQQGWRLDKVTMYGLVHHFSQGSSRKVRYFSDVYMKTQPDYEQVFLDSGWDLVYGSSGTYLWRKEYTDERPEAYSDRESSADRYKRFIAYELAMLVVFVLGFIYLHPEPEFLTFLFRIIMIAGVLVMVMGLYIHTMLLRKVKRLKR